MSLIAGYRERTKSVRGYRRNCSMRSRREEVTFWCCLVGMLLVISFIGQLGWSTAVTLSAQLACGAMLALAWMAWEGWGRNRFPLPGQEGSETSTPPDGGSAIRELSVLSRLMRGLYLVAGCSLIVLVGTRDLPFWLWVLAFLAVVGLVCWIGWTIWGRHSSPAPSPGRSGATGSASG